MTRMVWSYITWALTVLAAVAVLLTRIRLGSKETRVSGVTDVSTRLLTWHTGAGVVALVTWVLGLVTDTGWLVWLGVAAFWVVAVVGLLLLARWLPTGGKHSGEKVTDEWGEGAGLSALAHVGMLLGVWHFTFVAITDRV
jgi:hypothetical protein